MREGFVESVSVKVCRPAVPKVTVNVPIPFVYVIADAVMFAPLTPILSAKLVTAWPSAFVAVKVIVTGVPVWAGLAMESESWVAAAGLITLVVAAPEATAEFAVSVAVNVCMPAVSNVTVKKASPLWNVMGDTFAVGSEGMLTLTGSEKLGTTILRYVTPANSMFTGTPTCALKGDKSTNCCAVEFEYRDREYDCPAVATDESPGTPLKRERISSGSKRS